MNRAQINRQIGIEQAREGLLCLWLQARLSKDRRGLRRKVATKKRQLR